jgi:ABC-2 type transport system permease protein
MSAPLTNGQAVMLVARREFITQVKSRSFIIGIVFTLVVLVAVGAVSFFISASTGTETVGISGQAAQLRPALEQAAQVQGVELQIVEVDEAAGQTQVANGELDALLTGGPGDYRLLFNEDPDSGLQGLVGTAAQQQTLGTALTGAGINPATLAAQSEVATSTLEPEDPNRGQQIAVAFAGTFLLFMGIQYAAGVASGVVEEKQSRVVELLLATIKPWHLLAGKILGIGASGLLTMVILGAVVGAAAGFFGLLTLPSAAVGMLVMVLIWYLIGFFLFAAVYAALGSTVSRQEELQPVITPVVFVVIIPFILTLNLLPSDPRNPVITVLSYIPFVSQTVMPARFALGAASLWEVLVAALIALVAIAVVVRLAARIYSNSVLRTGARVSLAEALRGR